jgi:hypothetical protein
MPKAWVPSAKFVLSSPLRSAAEILAVAALRTGQIAGKEEMEAALRKAAPLSHFSEIDAAQAEVGRAPCGDSRP